MACIWSNTHIRLTATYVAARINPNEFDGHGNSPINNSSVGGRQPDVNDRYEMTATSNRLSTSSIVFTLPCPL